MSVEEMILKNVRHIYEQEDTMSGDLRAPECKIYSDFYLNLSGEVR